MDSKTLSYLFAVALIIVIPLTYFGGYYVGKTSIVDTSSIKSLIKQLPDGSEVTISYENGETPSVHQWTGSSISAKSETWLNRTFSFFGEGAIEGFDKMKNMTVTDQGVNFGEQRGYGVLEKWFSRLKSIFWVGVILLIVLFVAAFIPALAPIATTILRAIASIFPIIGAGVEHIVGLFKVKEKEKIIHQVVKGGEKFKQDIKTQNHLSVEHKQYVLDAFKSAHQKVQDEEVQKVVKNIK